MTITAIHLVVIRLPLDMTILMVLLNNTIDMNGTPLHHQKGFMIIVAGEIMDLHIEKEAMVLRGRVALRHETDILLHLIIEMSIEEGVTVIEAVEVVVMDITNLTWISGGSILMKSMARRLVTIEATPMQKDLAEIMIYNQNGVVTGALCNGIGQLGFKKGKARRLLKEKLGRMMLAQSILGKKNPIVAKEHLV